MECFSSSTATLKQEQTPRQADVSPSYIYLRIPFWQVDISCFGSPYEPIATVFLSSSMLPRCMDLFLLDSSFLTPVQTGEIVSSQGFSVLTEQLPKPQISVLLALGGIMSAACRERCSDTNASLLFVSNVILFSLII